MRLLALASVLAGCCALAGCGTTRWTDTSRSATEQLLLSDAIDRAVSRIDFTMLSGQDVYLDTSYLANVVDKEYLVSTLRQHMLASACTIKDKREDAEIVVEARAGTVGTDRHDLLCGIPAINLPVVPTMGAPTPTALPEIALAKRTDQKGVAKVAVFAYHRESGEPVWQSGVDTIASKAQNSWLFGIGPVQKGTIYDKAQFAGREVRFPLLSRKEPEETRTVRVTRETKFNDPRKLAKRTADGLTAFADSLKSKPAAPLTPDAVGWQPEVNWQITPAAPPGAQSAANVAQPVPLPPTALR